MVLLIAKIASFRFRELTCNCRTTNANFGLEASLDHIFFENEACQVVTVTGVRYRYMISQSFLPKSDAIDVANMWFQQDDATCPTASETIQLLYEIFPGRVLSRFGDQNCPLDRVISSYGVI